DGGKASSFAHETIAPPRLSRGRGKLGASGWPFAYLGTRKASVMSASRMPGLVLLDTKFVARQAALSARRTPTAGLHRAGDLLYGATLSRSRLERQYSAADWIKLSVTCVERVRCADVGGANFSFPLNTLSCSAIFRSIAPRPLCCILRPPAPAA